MKNTSQKPAPDRQQQTIQATAWFSVLMHAKSKENFQEAAEALAELQRLGVIVKFRRERRERKGGGHE